MSDTTLKATAAASGASATDRFRTDKATASGQAIADTDRVNTLATELISAVHDVIRRHQVTYEEYNALKSWLISVGEDGEWPLFLDVWIEHVVEEVAGADRKGSKGTIEGPYYVPGAPDLPSVSALPMREDEAAPRSSSRARSRESRASPCPARCWSCGRPTTTACTRSSHPASPSGTCAVPSRPTTRDASRYAPSSPPPTRSPPTDRAASSSPPPAGTPGARPICT